MNRARRLPIGAEALSDNETHFRVWAPGHRRIEVVLESSASAPVPLQPDGHGYFAGRVPVGQGTLYRFRIDGKPERFPDPASRFQPDGPHGPSQVIDPKPFPWTDANWPGCGIEGQIIYELHVGTFTREGTWQATARELPELARLGVTVLEVMPVADFPGRFGWGYDGVNLFAPTRLYGSPDDFRRFVDQAHAAGLGVILDVVYNHFGPDGNYLRAFSAAYFNELHKNEWGEAINFDGPDSGPVREFFVANSGYWIDEFHLDGLRLDATQQIHDSSAEHVLTAIGRRLREAARGRKTLIVAENDRQEAKIVRPVEKGGYGLDGLWNDDFHHSAHVALTGKNGGYYNKFLGEPQELLSAVKWGFLFQGQRISGQSKGRGFPALDLHPWHFVTFIQNHDQIANSARGERCHLLTSPGRYKAMTALMLLAPGTPMLFQGQEFAATSPFVFFADHHAELARLVAKGRRDSLAQFAELAQPETQAIFADPANPKTFERCQLDFTERERHAGTYALHRDLIALRKSDPVFRAQRRRGLDGAVLGPQAFVLRLFGDDDGDRLLIVNLGRDLHLDPAPEPLLAPQTGRPWQILWSSDDLRYGGSGTPPLESDAGWHIPGEATVVLKCPLC
ncbi:MAG: malto-oligosyltrehalose trehalohydrolase [Planctomycetes bacterium]|nr:malto-oligosyltrehalose trehalohydrolase [Planctomycetota bacterium]